MFRLNQSKPYRREDCRNRKSSPFPSAKRLPMPGWVVYQKGREMLDLVLPTLPTNGPPAKERDAFRSYRIGPDLDAREREKEETLSGRDFNANGGCVEHHERDGTRAQSCVTKKTVNLPAARQVTAKRRANSLKSIAAGGFCGHAVFVESPMNSIRRGERPFGRRFHTRRSLTCGTGLDLSRCERDPTPLGQNKQLTRVFRSTAVY